ncbi:hypothetical protein EMPS_08078 [Entomortierella parvispora]|uniref:Uncharacterized protein n=1 Tax=Entomortierella parvispora TaxID=205924 RepID=A0A9P3HFD4_9FUNG|nr:hypothetical protein EMPS_08078 [Entomortierella parvispora]
MDPSASVFAHDSALESTATGASSKSPSQQNLTLTNARNMHFSFDNVRRKPQSRRHVQDVSRGSMGPPSNGPLLQRRQSLKRRIEEVHPDVPRKVSAQRSPSQSQQRTSISQLSRQLGLGLKALSQSQASSFSERVSQTQQLHNQKVSRSQQQSAVPTAMDTVPHFQKPSDIARSLHVVHSQPSGYPSITGALPKHRRPSAPVKTPDHGQLPRIATTASPNYRRPSGIAKSLHDISNRQPSRASTSTIGPSYQSLAKVANTSVIPRQTTPRTMSHSRKQSFSPPLVLGGYAERLFDTVTRQRSGYAEWANTTMRKEKIFGAMEPLATVVITHISNSHGLQLCQCKVICSGNNQLPFGARQTSGYPGDTVEVKKFGYGYTGPTTSGATSESTAIEETWPSKQVTGSVEANISIDHEDPLYGLEKNLHGLYVISSQGSIFGHPSGALSSQVPPPGQNAQQSSAVLEGSLRYLKSSQGSEDEYDEEEASYGGYECNSRTKNTLNGVEDINNEVGCFKTSINVPTTISDTSGINDRSVDCATPAASAVQGPVWSSMESQGSNTAFTIIFSNLFNWSTLKILDRVEIHDPCIKLTLPKRIPSACNDPVWIVERYRLV